MMDRTDIDAVVVAQWVASASDDELREALGGELRAGALDEIVRRFPDYLDAERTAGVDAVFALRITGRADGGTDRYVVALSRGACEAARDDEREADVTLELDAVDFVKLVRGNVNPALLALGGRLRIDGDERLAIALTRYFRTPAEGSARIDPTAVDSVEIARLIEHVPESELRKRMRGALRELVLEEIFRRIPSYLDPRRSVGEHGAIEWKITGREDGQTDRYAVVIENGRCRAGKELRVEPRVTLRLDAAHLLKLVTGNANPTLGFLFGKLKVKGDLAFAARLTSLFKIPSGDTT